MSLHFNSWHVYAHSPFKKYPTNPLFINNFLIFAALKSMFI